MAVSTEGDRGQTGPPGRGHGVADAGGEAAVLGPIAKKTRLKSLHGPALRAMVLHMRGVVPLGMS